ncbi:DUF669 domain-containing protein [Lacticaseibacillus parakribbianus]|uniref:DUF669 domain-containing protein n=1 Tax=Lacticaseibacillus parakribbianus TaxID=2970927 RepID=UPI0021CB76B9|nr:DUF669 domain-containing protein [Lacticaseibacillus parakribbianus]
MSFTYDENNAGIKPLESGEYEVYPSAWETQVANSGNNMILMNYRVRSDVEQNCAGSEIRRDNYVITPNSMWRFNALTKAVGGVPQGFDFGTPENWAEAMLGKPFRVSIEMVTADNGKQYSDVKSLMQTQHPQMTEQPVVKHHSAGQQAATASRYGAPAQPPRPAAPDPFADAGKGTMDISDDDLPF